MSVTWMPILPLWTIVVVVMALTGLLIHGSIVLLRKRISRNWIVILGALRVVSIVLFALCLLRPIVMHTSTEDKEPDLLVLLDTSLSMSSPTLSANSRLADTVAKMRSSGLQSYIQKNFNVHWFAFDENARPIRDRDLEKLVPAGKSTCFADSLETAWNCYRNADPGSGWEHPAKILLISDGNDRGIRDVVDVARQVGVTVYVVVPADAPKQEMGPVVTITGIQSPRRVLLGSECRFRVAVRHENAGDMPLRLELAEDGQPVTDHEFSFTPGKEERHINLAHRPTSMGAKRYTFRAAPIDDKKILHEGGPYELTVKVVGRDNKVLLFEDTWRWDVKFLRRLLEDDPSFSFTCFLSRGTGAYMQFAEPDTTVKLGGFPRSRAELEWFDIIILGDVDPRQWPQVLAPSIHQLVVEQGRSLVIIAGPNIARIAAVPQLEALLPVEITPETARPLRGPVNVSPTKEGRASPMFYRLQEGDKTGGWRELPPADQIYPPLRKKPAATILLDAPDHTNPFGNLIVIAEHTVGRGRVLYIGTDTLWKWQMSGREDGAGNTPYRVFWQQALRALAPNKWTGGHVNFWVQSDRSKYVVGQTVSLDIEYESNQALGEPEIEAKVEFPDGRRIPLAIMPDPRKSSSYRAEFEASVPGRYRILADMFSDGQTIADVVTTLDVDSMPDETARASVNGRELDRIAGDTGGKRIDPDNTATWPTRDKDSDAVVTRTVIVDLWHNFSLLIVLIALLGTDWLLRLLRGLV